MLNSRKKIRALSDKKINILTRVARKENSEQTPPCKLDGRSLRFCNYSDSVVFSSFLFY